MRLCAARPPSADAATRAPTIASNYISSSVSFGDNVARPSGGSGGGATLPMWPMSDASPRKLSLKHRAASANADTAELFSLANAVAAAEPSFAEAVGPAPPAPAAPRVRHGPVPSISLPVADVAAGSTGGPEGPPTPALAHHSASDELYDETQQFQSLPLSPLSPAPPGLLTSAPPSGLRPVRTSRSDDGVGSAADAAVVVLPPPPAPRVTIKDEHTLLGGGAALGAADAEGDLLATGDGGLSALLADMQRQVRPPRALA